LRGYTLRQLRLYAQEAGRIRRERRAALILDVNTGMAGGDAASRRVRELIDDQ